MLTSTDIPVDRKEPVAPGHTVVRSLSAGPNGSLVLAVNTATEREVVVKVFRPPVLIDTEAERVEHARRVAAFLDVARMQQELSTTAQRWAPVHEFGPLLPQPGSPAGAYYTTDVLPASAEWLIRGHVSLNAATLRNLVAGVLDALAEVRACCGRGHGNLTPGNVLLSNRDPRSANVVLTDPSPQASPDESDDQADDRWAVGALIYGLVTHKPVHRMMLLPIAATDDWARLGRGAEKWVSLCNQLLAHDPAQRPDLAALASELGGVRAPAAAVAGRWIKRAAVACAALAVCAAGALGAYAHAYRLACQADGRAPWVRSLVASMADSKQGLATAIAADPSIQSTLPGLLAEASTAGVDTTAHPLIPSPSKFQAARRAAGTVAAIRKTLDDHHWKLLADVEQLQKNAEQRGWRNVSTQLGQLVGGLPPGGDDQAGDNLRAFLVQAPALLTSAQQVSADWKDLTLAAGPLAASSDPAVVQLAAALQANAAATVQLKQENPGLAVTRNVFYDLAAFVRTGRTMDEYHAVCDGIRPAFGAASPPDLDYWLQSLRDNYVHVAVDVSGLKQSLSRDQTLLAHLSPQALGGGPLQQRYNDAAAEIETIGSGAWTGSKMPEFVRRSAAVQSALAALAADLHTALVTDWLDAVGRDKTAGSDCPAWKAALAAMVADVPTLAADDQKFDQRKMNTGVWLAFLQHLDGPIRAVARLPQPYAGPVQERRVREIWAALPPIDVDVQPPDGDTMAAAAERRSAWSSEIQKFAQDFPLAPKYSPIDLSADDVCARWTGTAAPAANRSFWEQEVDSPSGTLHALPWMAADAAHLAVLDATGRMDRKQLTLASVDPKSSIETAFISRQRLANLGDPNPWPRTPEELKAAADWLKIVQPVASSYGVTDADLIQRQRQAWVTFVANAAAPGELQAAVNRAAEFGVTSFDDANTALATHPAAVYNLLVYRARQPGGGGVTAEQLRQSINQLAPPDAQLASAALPQQASDEQIRSAIDSNTWYRWPGAKFAPQAVAPPVAVAQNASAGTQPPNPAAPAGAAAGTAAAKPAAPHKRAHHVAGAVDNVD